MATGEKNIAEKIADKVEDAGKGFFGKLISAPFDFIKGAISAPFGALLGLGKGVWSGTVGNIGGIAMGTGVITLLTQFAPDLIAWLPLKVNGKKVGETMADHAREDGFPGIIKDALLASVAFNGALGGLKGAVGGTMGDADANAPAAKKAGNIMGTVGTLGLLGVLAFQAVNSSKVGFVANDDNATPKTPNVTPAATADAAKAKIIG
jgi:hypothetical protein